MCKVYKESRTLCSLGAWAPSLLLTVVLRVQYTLDSHCNQLSLKRFCCTCLLTYIYSRFERGATRTYSCVIIILYLPGASTSQRDITHGQRHSARRVWAQGARINGGLVYIHHSHGMGVTGLGQGRQRWPASRWALPTLLFEQARAVKDNLPTKDRRLDTHIRNINQVHIQYIAV